MLFMNVYSCKEGKREEIIKRRLEIGTGVPDGVKIIAGWTDLSANRGFLVFETDKPNYAWTMAWNDLLDMEIFPVLDTEKRCNGSHQIKTSYERSTQNMYA